MDNIEIKTQTKDQLLKAVQRFRKDGALTQKDLSDKTGLPQTSISKFELSTREPSLTMLFKILSALGLELVVRKKKRPTKPEDGIVI